MKTVFSRSLAVAGLCTMLVGVSGAAFAQKPHHPAAHARHHIHKLQARYARAVARGDRAAAARAHAHAMAIRHRVRKHEMLHH